MDALHWLEGAHEFRNSCNFRLWTVLLCCRNIAGLRFLTTQASGGPQLLSCTHGGSLQIHAPALDSNDEVWERLAQWTVPAEVSSMV
jgi:hypothetical protein